jgi:alkyl hydroperoxide reductase subunit F
MLDLATAQQLKEVFSNLKSKITLEVYKSDHPSQPELLELLSDVGESSPQITLSHASSISPIPAFQILKNDAPTGIAFRGIPNGHEFTSLVLAILNADGSGRLPDEAMGQRIQNMKGPVKITTYISLTCEVCPEIVQSMNQIALLGDGIIHEMVDGGMAQEEVKELGVAGVPAVFIGGKLFHSGRASFLELVEKLELHLGQKEQAQGSDYGHFDVAVVGAGPAGVSAAIYSSRKGLKTVLIAEKIGGQVADTKGIENLISVSYTEGAELTARLSEHMKNYPIQILENRRVKAISEADHSILLTSSESLKASSIIIATGAQWRQLGVPGEKEHIGRGVAYCPHCDGPYFKDKKVAVVGGGNSGVEAAIDLSGICREVVLFEYMDSLKADKVLVDKLRSIPNVVIRTQVKVDSVEGNGHNVTALHYEERSSGKKAAEFLDGIFVQIGLSPNSGFVKDLVEVNQAGEIVVDPKGRTNKKGIYAAGDVSTSPFKQIVIAMGDGAKVALTAFEDRMRA